MKIEQRFLKYVNKADSCWEWVGFTAREGYGRFRLGKSNPSAHRVAYELFVGEVPKGFVVDHKCHNSDTDCKGGWSCMHRKCVNPKHLEAITQKENVMRGLGLAAKNANKTLCSRGHEFGEQSPYLIALGRRRCRECGNLMQNIRRQANAS